MGEASGGDRRAATPLPPGDVAALLELAQAFLGVEHAVGFYPEGHQARRAPVGRLVAALRALAGGGGTASLGFAEEEVLWEGALRGPLHPALRKMAEAFLRPGIARISWTAEVEGGEVEALVAHVAGRRGAAREGAAETPPQSPHLRAEGIDYLALMAEEGGDPAAQQRRDLGMARLQRLAADPAAELTAEELELLAGDWDDAATLAACILEGLGPAAAEGGAAVTVLRRLAAVVEEGPPAAAAAHEAALRAAGRELPPALRLRLVEAAIDAGRGDLFARAFAAPGSGELTALLAGNFRLDPAQIARLTRVFQHLVPRRLERMELATDVRSRVLRATDPEEALAANAWEEAQELLTGEGGDFMSPAYRELLARLAARGERHREAEAALARLPGLEADLARERTAAGSLAILAEQLTLATGEEAFRAACEGLAAAAEEAFAAGVPQRGLRALAALARAAGEGSSLAGPRAAVTEALRAAATPAAIAALLGALEEGDESGGVLLALAAAAPEALFPPLFAALAVVEEGGRRQRLLGLLGRLGTGERSEALARLGEAPLPVARLLLDALAAAPDPAAVGGVAALLGREDRRLRRDAVRVLARIDTPAARGVLAGLLLDEDEEVVRLAAGHLGSSGDRAAAEGLLAALAPAGRHARRGPETIRAVTALGWLRAEAAVPPIAALLLRRAWLGRRAHEELCVAAAHALARIGGAEARRALEAGAESSPAPVAALIRRLLARKEAP